ncbi:MAG: hypothetical protein WCH01_04215 [Methylococcaceae bacterium]
MQALQNGFKSWRNDVSTPCWIETSEAEQIGVAKGINGREVLLIFQAGCPEKSFVK